jgi:hypothetical protein
MTLAGKRPGDDYLTFDMLLSTEPHVLPRLSSPSSYVICFVFTQTEGVSGYAEREIVTSTQ